MTARFSSLWLRISGLMSGSGQPRNGSFRSYCPRFTLVTHPPSVTALVAPVSLRSTIPGPLLSQPVGYSRSLRASPTAGRSAGMVE